MVTVQSLSAFKFRAAYAGTASMQFKWVSSGHSAHWQFMPTLLDDKAPARFSQRNQGQVTTIELANRFTPAVGLIKPNVSGEILAPAIHFDIAYASDLWVFLLRSPWFPLRIGFGKSPLSISHGLAGAMAELQCCNPDFGLENQLKAYVSTRGGDFKKVRLILERRMRNAKEATVLGELTEGTAAFSWKPQVPSFDTVFTANCNMQLNKFVGFLQTLGAKRGGSLTFGSSLQGTFLLSDGPAMNYTLRLVGDKGFFGREKDETKLTLTP